MSVMVFDEEWNKFIRELHKAAREYFQKQLEKSIMLWNELSECLEEHLPKHPEVIHPATKRKQSKQRIHSLVTIRKPMIIRARTCC